MLVRKTLVRFAASVLFFSLLWDGGKLLASGGSPAPQPAAKQAGTAKTGSSTKKKGGNSSSKSSPTHTTSGRQRSRAGTSKKSRSAASRSRRRVPPTPRSIKLTSAFHASEQLRSMAQQLAATRSPGAYSGVLSYAQAHPGEGAAAAYLALGHAYMLDHRYPDAATNFAQARRAGEALDDYADYLGAQAAVQANRGADAYALLDHFADRYPDS